MASETALTVIGKGSKDKGRPPVEVTDQGLRVIEELAANGNAIRTIAAGLDMNRSTLSDVRKRQPEVEEAIQRGRGRMESELVGLLMKQARDGAMVPAMFLLKSMCGYVEGQEAPGTTVKATNVAIQIAPRFSESQFARLLLGPGEHEDQEAGR